MRFQYRIGAISALAMGLALASCGSPEPAAETAAEPTAETVATSEPEQVTTEDGAEIKMQAPVKTASGDPIRGPGGLEEKCLAKVAKTTGAKVNGTNHIEESQAAIAIYVNVEGAEAPWMCLGYKDGSVGEVSYTGDEGYL